MTNKLGDLLRDQLNKQEQTKVNKKLDTTGLTGKDRILMLAEIIKAHKQGRELQFTGRDNRPPNLLWQKAVLRPSYADSLDWRIKPISRTVFVNLYDDADDDMDGSFTEHETQEAARKHATNRAYAVAIPVTVEE